MSEFKTSCWGLLRNSLSYSENLIVLCNKSHCTFLGVLTKSAHCWEETKYAVNTPETLIESNSCLWSLSCSHAWCIWGDLLKPKLAKPTTFHLLGYKDQSRRRKVQNRAWTEAKRLQARCPSPWRKKGPGFWGWVRSFTFILKCD